MKKPTGDQPNAMLNIIRNGSGRLFLDYLRAEAGEAARTALREKSDGRWNAGYACALQDLLDMFERVEQTDDKARGMSREATS